MLLVIDVGNTQTAIGVYEGESLDRMWRIATNRDHTADELRVKLLPLLQSENLQASDITGAALASVVPQLTGAWTRAVQDLAGDRIAWPTPSRRASCSALLSLSSTSARRPT